MNAAQRSLTETPEGTVYEVFARFRDDAMHHVGSVIGTTDELALVYAEKLYDEWKWNELMIVPRAQITTIIAPD